jgi:hypothetical protein
MKYLKLSTMKKKKSKNPKYEFNNSCGSKKKGKCGEITLLPQMKLAA